MRTRTTGLLVVLFFTVVAGLALLPALLSASRFSQYYDWRYFETMMEMSRRTVLQYHQVPLWNPYSCGGEVDLANPQALTAAPTYLFVLLFGTAVGIKLSLCFYYFTALGGAYLLGRQFGLSRTAALLGGLGFGLSGYLALHLMAGHINFAGVALYPLLLVFYERALGTGARAEPEWVIPMGLCAAWIALLGGTFTPPMAGVLLALWAGMRALSARSLRPLYPLPLAALVALLVSAARMLPVLEFITDHPRPAFRRTPDVSAPWLVIADLFAWRGLEPLGGRRYYAHEYTARLPYVFIPLLLAAGFALVKDRARGGARLVWLWVFSLLSALLVMGNFSPVAPWSLLQRLPVLRDLRVPSRHLVLLTLSLPLIGGLGWDWLRGRLADRGTSPRALAIVGAALVGLCAADGVAYTAWAFRDAFPVSLGLPTRPVPFYQIQGHWRTMREDLFAGHGTLGCDEEAPLQRAEALDVGDVPQARLLDPDAGEVLEARFTPSVRTVRVRLWRETLLLINSNWNEHFRSDRGQVKRLAGRLAVDLAGLGPGEHTITLTYAPRSFRIGLLVSAVCLPLCLCLFVLARVRRRSARGGGADPVAR